MELGVDIYFEIPIPTVTTRYYRGGGSETGFFLGAAVSHLEKGPKQIKGRLSGGMLGPLRGLGGVFGFIPMSITNFEPREMRISEHQY